MTVVSTAPSRRRRRSVARLAPRDRACTIGQLSAHGRTPSTPCGSSTSPQKRPSAASRIDLEQLRRLRVEIADAAIAVDGEHALDDAAEQRLRLGFAPLELGGETAQLLAHAIHGGGQAAQLDARGVGDRHVEVAGADALGGDRHAAERPGEQAPERRRQRDHQQRDQRGEQQQATRQERRASRRPPRWAGWSRPAPPAVPPPRAARGRRGRSRGPRDAARRARSRARCARSALSSAPARRHAAGPAGR